MYTLTPRNNLRFPWLVPLRHWLQDVTCKRNGPTSKQWSLSWVKTNEEAEPVLAVLTHGPLGKTELWPPPTPEERWESADLQGNSLQGNCRNTNSRQSSESPPKLQHLLTERWAGKNITCNLCFCWLLHVFLAVPMALGWTSDCGLDEGGDPLWCFRGCGAAN